MYQIILYHIPEDNLHEYFCDNLESRKISEKLPTYPRGMTTIFGPLDTILLNLKHVHFITCMLHYKYLVNFTLPFRENVSDHIEKVKFLSLLIYFH